MHDQSPVQIQSIPASVVMDSIWDRQYVTFWHVGRLDQREETMVQHMSQTDGGGGAEALWKFFFSN